MGEGSASPEVSMAMRRKSGISPRSRSTTMRRSATCKSLRVMQHRQPLPSSTVSSALPRMSASSMPAAPNSLTTTAVPRPSSVPRNRLSNVVLPAPRNPVITVTGTRAPRARLSLRPNRPAAGDGKISFMGPLYPSHAPKVRGLEIHLQRIKPAGEAIDGVDDLALVDEHVVDLHAAYRRALRRARHESREFLGLVSVGNIVGAQAAVEEGAEHDLIGLPGGRHWGVFVDIMRAET